MKEKPSCLNVGCGSKYHKEWINLDLDSNNPDIISCNLLKGIPFPSGRFAVVYHSHVLEHLPKEKALGFIKECYRVLQKNGTIRVVVPDLENIVDEYKKCLYENSRNLSKETEANYDWVMLELYDQTVRNRSGGQMAEFLRQKEMVNEAYVIERMGHVGASVRKSFLSGRTESTLEIIKRNIKALGIIGFFKKTLGYLATRSAELFFCERYAVGSFRLGGEIHM